MSDIEVIEANNLENWPSVEVEEGWATEAEEIEATKKI